MKQPAQLVIYRPDAIESPEQAALAAARALGCTCQPEVAIHDGIRAVIRHDDDCPILRTGSDTKGEG
jgi:hypothetical protein